MATARAVAEASGDNPDASAVLARAVLGCVVLARAVLARTVWACATGEAATAVSAVSGAASAATAASVADERLIAPPYSVSGIPVRDGARVPDLSEHVSNCPVNGRPRAHRRSLIRNPHDPAFFARPWESC